MESGFCGADTSRPLNYPLLHDIDCSDDTMDQLGGRPISSTHIGGARALFADGGVRSWRMVSTFRSGATTAPPAAANRSC